MEGTVGRVHRGFYQAFKGIMPKLENALYGSEEQNGIMTENPAPLWITGHSLGGALATLFAAWLINQEKPFAGLYTFGAPRVGDIAFKNRLEESAPGAVWRVVNNHDLVTRVPFRGKGFRHAGRVVAFNSAGELDLGAGTWSRFLTLVNDVEKQVKGTLLTGVHDHDMDGYIRLLERSSTQPALSEPS